MRESDRKPGSYVLSYFGKTGINHFRFNTHTFLTSCVTKFLSNFFRVTAVCGDYYIGGRQFDSLQDLIGYYTHIR